MLFKAKFTLNGLLVRTGTDGNLSNGHTGKKLSLVCRIVVNSKNVVACALFEILIVSTLCTKKNYVRF